MKYTKEWEVTVGRQARWVDFENDYKTMDLDYMESVMWAFKQLWNKGLVYEKDRVMPYSWKAETPLSNFETRLDDSYRERKDPAVTVKFEIDATDVDFGNDRSLSGLNDDAVNTAQQFSFEVVIDAHTQDSAACVMGMGSFSSNTDEYNMNIGGTSNNRFGGTVRITSGNTRVYYNGTDAHTPLSRRFREIGVEDFYQ